MDDDGDGGRWVTYAQLAELRGITRKAAIRMTYRHHWRRQPGNDGMALVLVPREALTKPARQTPVAEGDDDTPGKPLLAGALAALEAALVQANDRAEAADRRAAEAVALADRTLAVLADDRAEAAQAKAELRGVRDELTQAQEAAKKAQETVEALEQAETARRARGRLRRAWDGWRGR